MSKVKYKSNTNGIEVTIKPEYVDGQVNGSNNLFIWVYHVVINNKSKESIQLVSRYWKIIDEKGSVQEVSGIGAVGQQPILEPNANFSYSSGVHLGYPSGIMKGHYGMKKDGGEVIDVQIPTFSLDAPMADSVIN